MFAQKPGKPQVKKKLRRRLPDSSRVAGLAGKIAELRLPTRESARIAWLAGLGERYQEAASAVKDILGTVDNRIRQAITDTRPANSLVVVGSAYARLLYGAVSPTTGLEDVVTLARQIVDNYVIDATSWLSEFDLPLNVEDSAQLSPGEQGSRLGEKASELLAPNSEDWVDVLAILDAMGAGVTDIELSDTDLRAVSLFGPTQRPHILINSKTRWAQSLGARRFTLAHELCHLILDREYGDELAIASGPWAPVAIEQRANAFAAAFLMPTWLLREKLASANAPVDNLVTIQAMSARLRVSVSSFIDRLYNLGELTPDERFQLRPLWPQSPR